MKYKLVTQHLNENSLKVLVAILLWFLHIFIISWHILMLSAHPSILPELYTHMLKITTDQYGILTQVSGWWQYHGGIHIIYVWKGKCSINLVPLVLSHLCPDLICAVVECQWPSLVLTLMLLSNLWSHCLMEAIQQDQEWVWHITVLHFDIAH